MKNLKVCFIITLLSLSTLPLQLQAGSEPVVATEMTEAAQSARALELTNRLEEINKMDKSNMKGSEKRVYRKEVRSIKKELNEMGGGVYISVGAIIIIILLLILLV
jgi:hypothetical protein